MLVTDDACIGPGDQMIVSPSSDEVLGAIILDGAIEATQRWIIRWGLARWVKGVRSCSLLLCSS